jgi:hypothetical protein
MEHKRRTSESVLPGSNICIAGLMDPKGFEGVKKIIGLMPLTPRKFYGSCYII